MRKRGGDSIRHKPDILTISRGSPRTISTGSAATASYGNLPNAGAAAFRAAAAGAAEVVPAGGAEAAADPCRAPTTAQGAPPPKRRQDREQTRHRPERHDRADRASRRVRTVKRRVPELEPQYRPRSQRRHARPKPVDAVAAPTRVHRPTLFNPGPPLRWVMRRPAALGRPRRNRRRRPSRTRGTGRGFRAGRSHSCGTGRPAAGGAGAGPGRATGPAGRQRQRQVEQRDHDHPVRERGRPGRLGDPLHTRDAAGLRRGVIRLLDERGRPARSGGRRRAPG